MGVVQLFSLSDAPAFPCIVLKWSRICVMLDCALDLHLILKYLPRSVLRGLKKPKLLLETDLASCPLEFNETKGRLYMDENFEVQPPSVECVPVSDLDVVLISSQWNMLALPFLTEHKDFRAIVYATLPALDFAKLLLEELFQYMDRLQIEDELNPSYKGYYSRPVEGAGRFCPMYSADVAQRSMNKVRPVAFNEGIDLNGLLNVTAIKSGYGIGACNWLITTDYHKFVYLSTSSLFSTHVKPIDLAPMVSPDVVVVSCLSQFPHEHPDKVLADFADVVIRTLRSNGNVLVPCYPTGLIYDMIEFVSITLDNSGLSDASIYCVSSVVDSCMAFANIFPECLVESKEQKVFMPEEPFMHGLLKKNGRLKYYSALDDCLNNEFEPPAVIFASHPSLRMGESVNFMELFNTDPRNLVVLVEPNFCDTQVLAPFEPLVMKVAFCPVDTRLNQTQLNTLLQEIKPKSVYIQERALDSLTQSEKGELIGRGRRDWSCTLFKQYETISVQLPWKYRKLRIDPALAYSVNLCPVAPGVFAAPLYGILSLHDNRYRLKAQEGSKAYQTRSIFCGIDFDVLYSELRKRGLEFVERKSKNADQKIIIVGKDAIRITADQESTEIIQRNNDDALREEVKQAILQAMVQL